MNFLESKKKNRDWHAKVSTFFEERWLCARSLNKVWASTKMGDVVEEVRECSRKKVVSKMKFWGRTRTKNGEWGCLREKTRTKAPHKCRAYLGNGREFDVPEAVTYCCFQWECLRKVWKGRLRADCEIGFCPKAEGSHKRFLSREVTCSELQSRVEWVEVPRPSCAGCWPLLGLFQLS